MKAKFNSECGFESLKCYFVKTWFIVFYYDFQLWNSKLQIVSDSFTFTRSSEISIRKWNKVS